MIKYYDGILMLMTHGCKEGEKNTFKSEDGC